jgi:hypothetical protein
LKNYSPHTEPFPTWLGGRSALTPDEMHGEAPGRRAAGPGRLSGRVCLGPCSGLGFECTRVAVYRDDAQQVPPRRPEHAAFQPLRYLYGAEGEQSPRLPGASSRSRRKYPDPTAGPARRSDPRICPGRLR